MEPKHELDDLLKRNMQFDADELPEPRPDIQTSLRKKVENRKAFGGNKFLAGLMQFLTMDIKLYHAGIAVAAVAIIFIALRHNPEAPRQYHGGVIVADTNMGSSLKDDSFLVKTFNTRIN